jgi:hypothetical protein
MMLVHRPQDIYDKAFFDGQYAGALESARVVTPLVCDFILREASRTLAAVVAQRLHHCGSVPELAFMSDMNLLVVRNPKKGSIVIFMHRPEMLTALGAPPATVLLCIAAETHSRTV